MHQAQEKLENEYYLNMVHLQTFISLFTRLDHCTCVPTEPVEPMIEMGFGLSHDLLSGSATARPGQAGKGPCCIEQHVILRKAALLSLFRYVKSTAEISTSHVSVK